VQLALTRAVSTSIANCALSFHERQPIEVALAVEQHRSYEEQLRLLGVHVISLPAEPDLPDAVFVEDTAVVVDEIAVIAAPRLESRQREVASVEAALSPYRPLRYINGTARLEGGDVLHIGRSVYVGLTQRTNREGVAQLADLLQPYGYQVEPIPIQGCLHLKTACTYLGQNTLLANRAWIDMTRLDDFEVIDVPPGEPNAANALLIGETVLFPASFPQTRRLLKERGFRVEVIDISELQKAEAGVTCCSIVLENEGSIH
jgi:dimethylargininase